MNRYPSRSPARRLQSPLKAVVALDCTDDGQASIVASLVTGQGRGDPAGLAHGGESDAQGPAQRLRGPGAVCGSVQTVTLS